MYQNAKSWRRKLRLQELVKIAKKELESGKKKDAVYDMLEQEMHTRWRLVVSTRKQYLNTIDKVLKNQYALA